MKSPKKPKTNQPLPAVYPDSRQEGGAPVADQKNVEQAKNWVDHNKK